MKAKKVSAKVALEGERKGFNHESHSLSEALGIEHLNELHRDACESTIFQFSGINKVSQAVELVEKYLDRTDLSLREKAFGVFSVFDLLKKESAGLLPGQEKDPLKALLEALKRGAEDVPEGKMKIVGHS